jgi:ubiquinone/menaquinone biosynthesis C-methylase UbiE
MPDADWWRALWPDPRDVILALGVAAGIDVIDLCCGDGWFTAPLASLARKVFAIDVDEQMLEQATKRVAAVGAENCEFLQADAYDLGSIVPRPVDLVLMANTFHGVPDPARLARAMAAVLRPGGRATIVNWHRRPREETVVLGQPRGPRTEMRMSPDAVQAVLEPAGLRHLHTVELLPYHYGAVFEKPRAPSHMT